MQREQIVRHSIQAALLALALAAASTARGILVYLDVYLVIFLIGNIFCGWACPFGTLQEAAGFVARKLKMPRLPLSPRLDAFLGALRYVPLFLAVGVLARLDIRRDFVFFMGGRPIAAAVAVTAAGFFTLSLFSDRPFCRWICPKGAALGLLSLGRIAAVRKSGDACVGCGVCSQKCPMGIEVAKREQVVDPRCINCLECVSACPKKGTLSLRWRKFAGLTGLVPALCAAAFFFFLYFYRQH